ncbi:MAG: heavy-metal-associated domain-containing protein [Fimbriimonadaceae bacterium]|nr:heavy-metal-associated domain-containing protein [Fimbriimonadaceae bacterium]QYK58150.1 MAG: heavy-metal-associated domain-containing protein [Fimbriimonadaceae bacterium]
MKLIVEGLICQNCVRHVREALETIPGASEVQVNLETGEVTANGIEERDAIAAILDQGYRVVNE